MNEDVFVAPPFHGGKIMDSDIQEISEQIHRLLLQVKKNTLGQSIQAFNQSISLSDNFMSACSQSITWAPVVTAAMVVMVHTNSR